MVACNATMCEYNQEAACVRPKVHVVVNDDDVPACNVFGWDKSKWAEMTRMDMYEAAAQDFVRAAERFMQLTGAINANADKQLNPRFFSQVFSDKFYRLPGPVSVEKIWGNQLYLIREIGGVKIFRVTKPLELQDYLPWDLADTGGE